MARILVTGGTGYIGSHTVVELMQKDYDVVIVDNLSNSDQAVLDGITAIVGTCPDFVQADCCDTAAIDALFARYNDIVGVIHFAASKAVNDRHPLQKPAGFCMHYRPRQKDWKAR